MILGERADLITLIEKNGDEHTHIVSDFREIVPDVLVAKKYVGPKVEYAEAKNIPVLAIDWVYSSVDARG